MTSITPVSRTAADAVEYKLLTLRVKLREHVVEQQYRIFADQSVAPYAALSRRGGKKRSGSKRRGGYPEKLRSLPRRRQNDRVPEPDVAADAFKAH